MERHCNKLCSTRKTESSKIANVGNQVQKAIIFWTYDATQDIAQDYPDRKCGGGRESKRLTKTISRNEPETRVWIIE